MLSPAGKLFRLQALGLCVALSLGNPIALVYAADVIQFNTDVLDINDRKNIDLSQFTRSGYIMPGVYTMVVHVNKNDLAEQPVTFMAPENDPKGSEACLSPELVNQLGLKEKLLSTLNWTHGGRCLDASSLAGMEARGDLASSSLYLNIPQAYLEYSSENWDPPSRWDDGIPGLLFDYNVNAQTQKHQKGGSSYSLSGNGTGGANLGAWRLRADWQANLSHQTGSSQSTDKQFDWSRYYAYRAIPALRSRLTMGEDYLNSDIFDSLRFTGVSLRSDDSMLPPNLRGYAPEVTGVAKTNAKVVVSQQGRVLYETQVAAGPFRIQDINDAVSGELDVRVEEQDGSVQTFKMNTANIPYLTRPGTVRYKLATGKPSEWGHHLRGPMFGTGEFSWGISNGWSLYGGGIAGGDYNALSLGIGRDLMALGALSFDATQSRARLPQEGALTGGSYRLSYSKNFDQYDSQITFAGYRFSQRKFMNMSQYLQERYGDYDKNYNGRQKELYTITASKTFMAEDSARAITTYLTYSHQTYWDARTQDRYGLSTSKLFSIGDISNITASLSAYRTYYQGRTDDSVMLNFTVPIGDRRRVGYALQTNNGDVTQTASYNDYSDPDNTWQVSGGFNQSGKSLARGYYTHNASFGSLNASASYQQDSYSSIGGSFRGGLTATRHGIAAHQNSSNGGSRMMLDTDGIAGVPINNGRAYSNRFGLAVISDITSYYNTDTRIDVNKLADDVEATRAVVQGTLTEGAIGYRHFEVVKGSKLLATIRLADGSEPPFGAAVLSEKGREVAVVNDGGSVYLTGVQPEEKLDVAWEGQRRCRIVIPGAAKPLDQLLLPCATL
ncbi:outer membrane usher protein [Serratia marcescens]|nr:outer membrane usher protein [Serratia marcescens]RTF25237.1 outer membrane usher protein [Serratia marcescens]RTF45895.1 outer membrane usher protein [Serratia marcescens]RTF49002.1 outer membrane usher protein [Serratia marcescens]RTF72551.1 outer membrane usher protein [Serratia marcescens]RTF81026.1 outer membrane usher protein [Serratia marcescens]